MKKRRLKLKEDELKSISEFHLSEIESIKDHIKYLLYQQQNESTNLKNNAQVQLFSVQDEYAKGIDKKNTDVTEYQSLIKEAEVSHNNFMVCLHRDYDSRVDKMCEEFKRRLVQDQWGEGIPGVCRWIPCVCSFRSDHTVAHVSLL